MSHFYIDSRRDKDLTILDLEGRLGIGSSNMYFGNTIQRLSDDGQNQIILNFSGISRIDRSGLGAMIKGYQKITGVGGQLKICTLNTKALELMTFTKLLTIFEVFENEKSATDSFQIRRNQR